MSDSQEQNQHNDRKLRAVVLVSGGLDSATVLACALAEGFECFAISFDYGQRHRAELEAAKKLSAHFELPEHKIVRLNLDDIGGSSLTDHSMSVPETMQSGIPSTYVPARNTVFLSIALGYAEVIDADAIYIGVNAVDYSGYPDCRPEYIAAFQTMANLATKRGIEGRPIAIRTPLIDLTKGQIIQRGVAAGLDYAETVSCYKADSAGYACGVCDSCRIRKLGFEEAGLEDPTLYA